MRSLLTGLVLGLWVITFTQAQTLPATSSKKVIPVKGLLLEQLSGQPLAYATVSLFQHSDSVLITGGLTNENGRFSLEAPPGAYYAVMEFLSYNTLVVPDIIVEKKDKPIDLGIFTLSFRESTLEVVEVRAEKSELRITLDKKVYTVGKDIALNGGDASGVLDNIPTVTIDPEGRVNLRGSSGVKIWVDGRPSGLMNLDIAQGLKSIPANMIDRVELITNPSARYDAESVTGIINILLKKEQKNGLNGNVQLSGNLPLGYSAGINLNWQVNRVNLFANLNYRYLERPRMGWLYQERQIGDTTYLTHQFQDLTNADHYFFAQSGLDYQINQKSTLTFSYAFSKKNGLATSQLEYDDFVANFARPLGQSFRFSETDRSGDVNEYNLTYVKKFSREGQELVLDLRYQETFSGRSADLLESPSRIDNRMDNLYQRSQDFSDEGQFIAQLDYVHPLGGQHQLEMGLRTSLRAIDNVFFVDTLKSDGSHGRLQEVSNDFQYEERISGAYVLFNGKQQKWSYQLGLRTEISDVTTLLLNTDEENPRTYTNLFPSAAITYDWTEDRAFQLSYSRRLKRPQLSDLRPFTSYSDRRNLAGGNPNLDPEYANSLDLAFLKYWDKASFTTALFYRHANRYQERLRLLDKYGVFRSRPENLGYQDAFGLEVVSTCRPFPWWQLSGDFNFYYAEIDGGPFGPSFHAKTYSVFGRITSSFLLWKKLRLLMRYHHRQPRNTTQGRNNGFYRLDAAASYPFLNNKAMLSISGTNILDTFKYQWNNSGKNFYNQGTYIFIVPSVRLSLTYQINKNIRRKSITNKSSAEYGSGESY